MTKHLQELLDNNRVWADQMESKSPGFFTNLTSLQAPQYLWIGCADSRVPANDLVNLLPGELFVHRNVGNIVSHSDLNCLSVIQFATDVLKVKHIIVVGHSNCGGVGAALNDRRIGLADNWIRHIKDVRNLHHDWLETLDPSQRVNALCELNVIEQAMNVCETTIVEDAWQRGQEVVVHGWVYGLHNGLLEDLTLAVTGPEDVAAAYATALAAVKGRYDTRDDARDEVAGLT
ncbi:carbonate dehydratase [soil metagenome]